MFPHMPTALEDESYPFVAFIIYDAGSEMSIEPWAHAMAGAKAKRMTIDTDTYARRATTI
jgi:hypothetical protein